MQYILTQEEYDALKEKQKLHLDMQGKKLQELCTKICDTMPVDWGWGGRKGDPENIKPWGCILTYEAEAKAKGEHYYHDDWYCDQCPVQDICPHDWKSWSK